MRRLLILAVGFLSFPALMVSIPAASVSEVPGTDCRVFPANNIWNTRIDQLPVHEMSETWLRSSDAANTDLHPDFGPPGYALPFETVARRHPKTTVDFDYADESDRGPYPFDARAPIEGGSDRHALMVERGTCVLYELFAAHWNGGDARAGSGAIWDLDSNRLRPETWTSADAAGLPIFPGPSVGTRSRPDASNKPSASRWSARPIPTSGRLATRRGSTIPTALRWAPGSA